MVARSIFVGGTSSHAGKSWMATAICRWLRRRGFRVAPFKAQNMSLNSYPCAGGGEIGRAQVVQAEACGLEPVPDMNPILLKPNSRLGSQVIVDGKVWRNLPARDYYDHFPWLLERVMAAYGRLAAAYDYVVIEGAGSVTEMNLRDRDLVNLGLAVRTGSPCLLVSDIDRGGVFASIVGTFCLLEPAERGLLRGFAVNRFRGDPSLFADGVAFLENKTGRKCLGVFPYAADLAIDAEDSVSLEDAPAPGEGSVAALRFPRISNFTDLRLIPGLRWVTSPVAGRFGCVILPGSKNTVEDLKWLRSKGLDAWLRRQREAGAQILGICGGYQMLGARIEDPHAVESDCGGADGLGFLPVTTVLDRGKTTRVVEAVTPSGLRFRAYEIHMGVTSRPADAEPFALIDGIPEGIRQPGCAGTYLHGALEDPAVLGELLGCSIAAVQDKDEMYDRLAAWFEDHCDVRAFEELYL